MQVYVRLVKLLVSEGMTEDRAVSLVAGTYGIDRHALEVVYHHRDEL